MSVFMQSQTKWSSYVQQGRPWGLAVSIGLAALLAFSSISMAQDCQQTKSLSQRFTVQGDIVIQNNANLEWKRCAVGLQLSSNGQKCDGMPKLLHRDAAIAYFQNDTNEWRIPDIRELYGLLDDTCADKQELALLFPDLTNPAFEDMAPFWSSSEDASLPGMFYFVDFSSFALDFHSNGYSLAMRAVRTRGR